MNEKELMIRNISNILQSAIDDKVFPGCVFGVVGKNIKRRVLPMGNIFDDDNSSVSESTIYDVASVTKAVPTSLLALIALENNLFSTETLVCDILPEIGGKYKKQIKIIHLLTHTLDFGFRLSSYKNSTPEELLSVILDCKMNNPPGTTFFYSNATSIILGLVLEKVFGDKLDKLGKKYVFEPLGMKNTSFDTSIYDINNIVPSEIDNWRDRIIRGEIHDESAFILSKIITPGSAGLFSNVPDLLNVIEMFLNGGTFNGSTILKDSTLKRLQTNYIANINESATLGWELNQSRYMGTLCSNTTIGKTGFTGCVIVYDLAKQIGFVLLSNYTFPKRKNTPNIINEVRRKISDVVFSLNS